jgi:hypothetical protein
MDQTVAEAGPSSPRRTRPVPASSFEDDVGGSLLRIPVFTPSGSGPPRVNEIEGDEDETRMDISYITSFSEYVRKRVL